MADEEVFKSISAKEVRTTILKGGADLHITADTSSAQGGYPLSSSFNVVGTAASGGDAVTLPAVFSEGTMIFVKNSGKVNPIDVFPALGDDLGEGANVGTTVPSGTGIAFIAISKDTAWTTLIPRV